jgi:hypothetical protein
MTLHFLASYLVELLVVLYHGMSIAVMPNENSTESLACYMNYIVVCDWWVF